MEVSSLYIPASKYSISIIENTPWERQCTWIYHFCLTITTGVVNGRHYTEMQCELASYSLHHQHHRCHLTETQFMDLLFLYVGENDTSQLSDQDSSVSEDTRNTTLQHCLEAC